VVVRTGFLDLTAAVFADARRWRGEGEVGGLRGRGFGFFRSNGALAAG